MARDLFLAQNTFDLVDPRKAVLSQTFLTI
jgi:hypothetical protein